MEFKHRLALDWAEGRKQGEAGGGQGFNISHYSLLPPSCVAPLESQNLNKCQYTVSSPFEISSSKYQVVHSHVNSRQETESEQQIKACWYFVSQQDSDVGGAELQPGELSRKLAGHPSHCSAKYYHLPHLPHLASPRGGKYFLKIMLSISCLLRVNYY